MYHHSDEYVYNYYSAAMTLFHHRAKIRNAYTCVEFVGDILSLADIGVKFGGFHSLPNLEETCNPYVVYEGSAKYYHGTNNWKEDAFREKMTVSEGILATAESFARLTKRGIEDAYGFFCNKFGVDVRR